jgi:acetyl-CoA carboxylase biotin carboxyl carrier protein
MQLKEIKELIDFLEEKDFVEIEYESEGVRIRLRRAEPAARKTDQHSLQEHRTLQPPPEDIQHSPGNLREPDEDDGLITVEAPMVGTFYRAPSPEADPFVEEGDVVEKGRVLCIIEAMKIMNEIESEVRGRVKSILAENGQPVGFGDGLFILEPL